MVETSSSSIKMAEDGSLFDIFCWPSLIPGSISIIAVKGNNFTNLTLILDKYRNINLY